MYSAKQHWAFAERLGNMMRELRQLQIEAVALQEIYTTQAQGGASNEFSDVDLASADELRSGVNVTASYLRWLTGEGATTQEDRRPVTTAFLQVQ